MFNTAQFSKPRLNKFDLSHEKKMSLKFGFLYPILHEEVIPSDQFQGKSEIFLRFAPTLAPLMQRLDCQTHYFFVPNRLIWSNWEDFITGGDDSQEITPIEHEFPYLAINEGIKDAYGKGSLGDYFGLPLPEGTLPTQAADSIHISALPFAAYQLIYDEYYRDENMVPKKFVILQDGLQGAGGDQSWLLEFNERAWAKDYFTSALPWTQKGGEAEIPVEFTYRDPSNAIGDPGFSGTLHYDGDTELTNASGEPMRIENLESSTNITINDLRKATSLQRWLEKQARGGTRYIEQIKSHFGITSSNKLLQRPQYLGGGSQPVQIGDVQSVYNQAAPGEYTDPSVDGSPAGTPTGTMMSAGGNHKFSYKSEEHGQLIGIMSVIPKASYQNGLQKKWQKFDKFDYFWPDFAHLGEQPINRTELYCIYDSGSVTNNDIAFGYTQRYSEYKYAFSTISGDFRDNLAYWHQSRIFSGIPYLNKTFIACRPRTDVFAVQDDTDYIWAQIYHKLYAKRPIPYFSIPELS